MQQLICDEKGYIHFWCKMTPWQVAQWPSSCVTNKVWVKMGRGGGVLASTFWNIVLLWCTIPQDEARATLELLYFAFWRLTNFNFPGVDRGHPPNMGRGGWGGRGGMDRMPPGGGFRDRRNWRDRYDTFDFYHTRWFNRPLIQFYKR